MDWIFLNEDFKTTDDFEDAKYIFIHSESWSYFLSEYEDIYDTSALNSDTWFIWDYVWTEVESDELLTKLNAIKKELEKESVSCTQKDNAKLPESSCNKTKQTYKVVIEDMLGSAFYLDCSSDNITDALHTIATAADPNIFGKSARKFTIEVIRE